MKKLNKINKKILAIVFLFLLIFQITQPIFAISSSGTGKWVAGQWDSQVFTTDNKTSVGMLLRRNNRNRYTFSTNRPIGKKSM